MIDDRANARVVDALHDAIASRGEVGLQVAAYLGGELVIDAWAGIADPASGRPVGGDTLFNVFSVSKAVASTAVHVQAERGLVEYDQPVARYWPEFGANGKDGITVRDVLNHHSGTPQMPTGTTPELICNWDAVCSGIARLAPILPRHKPAYQAMSFGWITGEIVRRTDNKHRSFRDFLREEIAAPYGIDDLWMGIDPQVAPRIATLVDEDSSRAAPEDSLFAQALPNSVRLVPAVFNLPAVRQACLPAVGGIFTARSEARFWAILAGGGQLDGKRLLSRQRVLDACQPRPGGNEADPVYFNAPMTLAQGGFWKPSENGMTCAAKGGSPLSICVPGAGGSLGWADPESGLAVAFCHNRMFRPTSCDSHPLTAIAALIRDELGL